MDIVSRLKKFLEQAGISNSQFADTCEIPRPTLSQLLNGRNKKVSDEVIGKIHRAYPTLNVMWLMFGDGEMLVNGAPSLNSADRASDAERDDDSRFEDKGQRAISFDGDDHLGYHSTSSKPLQRNPSSSMMNETTLQSMMQSAAAGRNTRRGSSNGERHVVNIFVFYSDGRFERFEPAQR